MFATKKSVEKMLPYELQYAAILETIMQEGELNHNERTDVDTRRIPSSCIIVDLQKEFPILQSKKVYWKSALKEITWIMQKQSNKVEDLGSHIWDQWADDEGTIGKAYGFQVSKPITVGEKTYKNQVEYVLDTLKSDQSNRRCVIDLWNVDDLGEMALTPCCYSSVWTITEGRLNCMLVQRSADFLVGVPFNTTQYAMLTYLFAIHLGVLPGILTHCMADTHVYGYKSHMQGAKKILSNVNSLYKRNGKKRKGVPTPVFSTFRNDSMNFFEMDINDFMIEQYSPIEEIKFDVAK